MSPVKWSGQHWRPTASPVSLGNVTHVFFNSKCVICRCFVQLERGIIISTQDFQLWHETVFRHVQVRVLINKTITEIWSEQSFIIHPTPYHDTWRIMFHSLQIILLLPGPEHKVPWLTVRSNPFIITNDLSALCPLSTCSFCLPHNASSYYTTGNVLLCGKSRQAAEIPNIADKRCVVRF